MIQNQAITASTTAPPTAITTISVGTLDGGVTGGVGGAGVCDISAI
jgi:hypothetical protein